MISVGRYAQETQVSVSKSRGEIEKCLRKFGAEQLQWSDDFSRGRAVLRFSWYWNDCTYFARFAIDLPDEDTIRNAKENKDGRTGRPSNIKVDRALNRRGMVEHRELSLFIKAALVAVEGGIITAEQLFLPFLEDKSGTTVAEQLLPRISDILKIGGTNNLLLVAKETTKVRRRSSS